jgi:malic enzyme
MPTIKEITLLIVGITASVALSALLTLQLKKQMPPKIAVVDIVGVTTEATESILNGSGTTEEKTKKANDFTARLNKTVVQLGQECRCVLLVSAAVISESAVDLTEDLRRALKP